MTPDNPHKGLLDRQESAGHIKEHFQPTVNLLREIVDYGTNLIVRCYETSDKKDYTDAVLLGTLLKHAVAMLDAIEVLVSEGAVFSANVQARSLFEAWLYIRWILHEDTENRAKHYFVWQLRQDLRWAKRGLDGSSEQQIFYDSIGDFKDVFKSNADDKQDDTIFHIQELENLLNNPDLKDVNQGFEIRKKRSGKDVDWFTPCGVSNRADMATETKAEPQYRIFYEVYSDIVHASTVRQNVKFGNQSIIFTPIRHLEGIKELLTVVMTFIFEVYRSILAHYRPFELMNFSKKYVEEWRQRFKTIKSVNYNVTIRGPR